MLPSAVAIRRNEDTMPNPMPRQVLMFFVHLMPRKWRARGVSASAVRGLDREISQHFEQLPNLEDLDAT